MPFRDETEYVHQIRITVQEGINMLNSSFQQAASCVENTVYIEVVVMRIQALLRGPEVEVVVVKNRKCKSISLTHTHTLTVPKLFPLDDDT